MRSSNALIKSLVQQLEEAYGSRAWHGTNLRGSLRGLSLDELAWRPGKNRHNIWEEALHCAYWKYIVRRRITGEEKGSFPLKGSNFFVRPVLATKKEWKNDLQLLEEMHRQLVEAVSAMSASALSRHPRGSKFTNLQTVSGIALHDVYHTGQIQLLKRLMRS